MAVAGVIVIAASLVSMSAAGTKPIDYPVIACQLVANGMAFYFGFVMLINACSDEKEDAS